MHRSLSAFAFAGLATLAACGREETGPWLAFDGGGFVVNYNGGMAAAFYGFNVKPLRHIPDGTVIEATMEDPAGGPAFTDRQQVSGPALRYTFRTPYLHGIAAKHPYKAEVHVLEAGSGKLLASYSANFVSQVDDAWLKK